MSHFDPGKRMQELKQKFVQQALERNSIPTDVAERIWEMMAAFAGYGFPKAHAASYAKLGWRSAWCKSHFRQSSWQPCLQTGEAITASVSISAKRGKWTRRSPAARELFRTQFLCEKN